MNIFKTFEIFLREPLSILRDRIIQVANINSDMITQASVDAQLLDGKAQITVVNSDKMYNLLKTVLYKKQKQAVANLPPLPSSRKRGQMVLGQLCKRA